MITYTMHHPQLSEPLELDSQIERTERALAAWAGMYILKNFDEMVDPDEWVITSALAVPAEFTVLAGSLARVGDG